MAEPDGLKLLDLVPLETLDRLRTLFKATVGVPMVFTDRDGCAVTAVEEPLRFCGSLVTCGAGGTVCLRREKWDTPEPEFESRLRAQHRGAKPLAHRCLGGFRDTAVPIVVAEQIVGYSVFARSLSEEPDLEAFRQMALASGMDAEVGEAVARHAVVMPEERIALIGEFLQVITELVARAAYDTIRARRVLELEKLRDDLVHMIVHDLRTPLTGVIGGLQTIIDSDYDPDITGEFVGIALSSGEHLLEMVNTLLDINKMEHGQMALNLSEVDLREVARRALEQVRGLAADKGQELTGNVEGCPRVQADEHLLRRVMVNLLGNALKFTQAGGHVALSVSCSDGEARIAVADNGPGIPPEYREKIFEKFGQVETRKAGRKNSTGLGLTFCRMVAEAHGGRIWVESEVGEGSAFQVAIPIRTGESE